MSGAGSSLDLSEFFNNDDSQGHRLAEFLRKRRGDLQRDQHLFIDCEPQRLSLNVQVEKMPPSLELNSVNNQKNIENENKANKNSLNSAEEINIQPCKTAGVKSADLKASEPLLPIPNANNFVANTDANRPPDSRPRALSPRISSIRKSGGISPNDRLRRYSLKRLSKLCAGRRTLLQEFESTIGDTDFQPQVYSTPLSQSQPDRISQALNSSQPLQTQNLNSNSKANNTFNGSCGHTETLINTLQRKDEELKNYMESLLENALKHTQCQEKVNKSTPNETQINTISHANNSSLKRTYTVEKGNISGQIIITPKNGAAEKNMHNSRRETQAGSSPNNLSKARAKSSSPKRLRSNNIQKRPNSSNLLLSHRSSNVQQANNSGNQPKETMLSSHEVSNNHLERNISIALLSQDVEIPETQDQHNAKESAKTAQTDIEVVVTPVNQISTRTCNDVGPNNNTIPVLKIKINDNLSIQQSQQSQQQLTKDNLKLNDILTDDEEEVIKAASPRAAKNETQAPLNLAQSVTHLRRNRIRKCTVALRNSEKSLVLNTKEMESPPQAHSNNHMIKRKQIPLNKAPGIPLNGEKFAQELARMSNYEILDLRKRNSMGRVFAISGRKSRRSQEEALKKQSQLSDEIDMELYRRTKNEIKDKQPQQDDNINILDGSEAEHRLPVPDGFRDSFLNEREPRKDFRESSFIDEMPSDRVSFKQKNGRLTQAKKKEMPKVLKQYLEVSQLISRKKKTTSFNKLKRSLYTQDHTESEQINKPSEKANLAERNSINRTKEISLPYVPSPPKSNVDPITTPKVLSPPSPFRVIPRKSRSNRRQQNSTSQTEVNSNGTITNANNNITLPLPPPGFESDSNVSNNNIENYSTTTSKLQTSKANIKSTTQSKNDEDGVFKKPLQPTCKPRKRKGKGNETLSNNLQLCLAETQQSVDNSAVSTEGTLRRSKRGHVPLKYSVPIFQLLFQQSLNSRLRYLEKQEVKKKQKQPEISKTLKNSTNSNSIASISNKKSTKTSKTDSKKNPLPTVLENDPIISSTQETPNVINKKKNATKPKNSKLKNKQNKNRQQIMAPTEIIDCSRLILTSPPPIDHLNNVFDQLRHTSSAVDSPSKTMPQPPLPSKVKPFKVRVARLKTSEQPFRCDSVSTTSSTIEKNSNYELISWLKNISESDSHAIRNSAIFKEMRISAASNLSFTEIQGVEYAFYDTDDKASLGYLRFKPRQIKPKKRAKRFHLHFITLVGKFRITANDKESRVGVGDMVAIEKSVYYDIENLTDDIGILMVIKK